ncbi:MAG: hypothetical protein ABI895_40830, partial [Deltaproteobacteria bacterium]
RRRARSAVEPPSAARTTPAGDTLGLRGTPMGEGGSAGTTRTPPASGSSTPGTSALPAPTGMLSSNGGSFDFGGLEVAVGSSSFTWRISNVGDVPTGALALLPDVSEAFRAQSGCPVSLPAGGSCSIEVSFAPTAGGNVAGSIQFGQVNQVVSLALTGSGRYRLDVQRGGRGEVTASGLTCTATLCTGLFDPGRLTLSARTQNGSGSFFTGWSAPECTVNDDCGLDLDRSRSITATFQELTSNLIFVTSSTYPTNVGGLAALDAECNRLASAAGINSAAGNDFIAAVSDNSTSLRQRLAGARGWVRRDGLPFGDSIAALFDQFQVLYSPWLTEHGALNSNPLMTGTDQAGASTPENCNNWTSLDASVLWRSGRPEGGPRSAISWGNLPCGMERASVYCMGTSHSSPVALTPASGKRIWLTTDSYTPGSMTPDEFCQSTRPAGVARGVAFVAYTTRPAAAVLDPEALYVRVDGALVGTGAEIAATKILAGPWLSEDGTVEGVSGGVWGGAPTPQDLADPAYNCNDWQSASNSANGDTGEIDVSSGLFFYEFAYSFCSDPREVRCVEP